MQRSAVMERLLAEILFAGTILAFVGGVLAEITTGVAAGIRNWRRLHAH